MIQNDPEVDSGFPEKTVGLMKPVIDIIRGWNDEWVCFTCFPLLSVPLGFVFSTYTVTYHIIWIRYKILWKAS